MFNLAYPRGPRGPMATVLRPWPRRLGFDPMKYGTGPVKDDDDEAGNSWSLQKCGENVHLFWNTLICIYIYIYIHLPARIYCAILWR